MLIDKDNLVTKEKYHVRRLYNWVFGFLSKHLHKLIWKIWIKVRKLMKFIILKWELRNINSLSMRLDSIRRDPWSTMITPSPSPTPYSPWLTPPPFPVAKHNPACPYLFLLESLGTFRNSADGHPLFLRFNLTSGLCSILRTIHTNITPNYTTSEDEIKRKKQKQKYLLLY